MVYQSVMDTFASFFMLLTAVVDVKGTGMSRNSIRDMLVCHIWLVRQQIWYFTTASTYGVLMMAFDRYAAVIYPIWYNGNVRLQIYDDIYFSAIVFYNGIVTTSMYRP